MSYQLIVMGVSGCGKSTVGQALGEHLNYPFYDGDAYHPEANIAKMQSGTPLNDDDRAGWLKTLNQLLAAEPNGVVLACSALKPSYRQTLTKTLTRPVFVYLKGDFDTIWQRHKQRSDHYFQGKAMLESQFDTLVEPTEDNVITLDVRLSIDELVSETVAQLKKFS